MTQQTSAHMGGATNDPITLATSYHLGTPVSHYKSATGSIIFRNLFFALLGVLCIATIFTGFSFATLVLFLLGIIMVSYAISRIRVAQRNKGTGIHICTEGLMRVGANSVEAVRWDAASLVQMRFRRSLLRSTWYASRYTFDAYVLRRTDGGEIIVDKAFRQFKLLGKDLEQSFINYLLPRMLAYYQAGQSIPFGDITVSQAGISLHNGQHLIELSELHYMRPVNGFLHVHWKKQGQKFYSNERILMNSIPNVFVLQALVKQLQGVNKTS